MHNKKIVWTLATGLFLVFFASCPMPGALLFAQTHGPQDAQPTENQRAASNTGQEKKQQPANRLPRQDQYYGTFHEGIVMETDPQSGDRVIQVSPPPEKEKDSNQDNTFIIAPEIKIRPR